MRFASLGSGSKGNATLVEGEDTLLLIDCGFSVREVRRRMARLGKELAELSAVLVTHEHGDHIGGVGVLARAVSVPVYLTDGTRRAGRDLLGINVQTVNPHQGFAIGSLNVEPVAVPHDAREPCQYVLDAGDQRLGVLTDLGSITSHVVESYQACDALVLECNHDSDMLREGPYPWSLKKRVGGDWGHLNNSQSAQLLASLDLERLQQLVVAHISQQNNTEKLALAALNPVLNGQAELTVANQDQGFDWIELA